MEILIQRAYYFHGSYFMKINVRLLNGTETKLIFFSGKRSCTGELLAHQELFLFFSTLIQHFDILPPEGQDRVDCRESFLVTMCPTPFEIRMIPHNIM